MSKVVVLHCITSLGPDGAQQMLKKLVTNMDRNRFENIVVAALSDSKIHRSLSKELSNEGIRVENLEMQSALPSPAALSALRSIIRQTNPAILQGWMYHGNLLLSAASAGMKIPVLWNIRHSIHSLRVEKPKTTIVALASTLFAQTARLQAIVYCAKRSIEQHARLGYPSKKAVIIPNGFDIQRFRPQGTTDGGLRRQLGLAEETPLLGIAGRYHPQKDHQSFLRAAVQNAERLPHVHYVMAGHGLDRSNKELTQSIEGTSVERRVHFLGPISDTASFYPQLTAYCSSSNTGEAFPNVLGEAMACGVPCVVTDIGASAEIVDRTGFAVEPGSVPALADAIARMFELSATERQRLGTEARQRVCSFYSLETVVDQYQALYLRCIADRSHPKEEAPSISANA